MQYYISEEEAMYMDVHHGQFSKKLAEWAIDGMYYMNEETGKPKKLGLKPLEDVEAIFRKYGVRYDDTNIYTAWYLYHMACADYRKALPTKDAICLFVHETLTDPDCDSTAVLACFRAKMDIREIPIHWERFI